MTYELYIGDKRFSSWSLRGWLMFEKFDIPYREHLVGLYSGTMAADLAHLAPARFVPAMQTPDGIAIGETMAMAEVLAEQNPDAGLYPTDPAARGLCRWLVAEMHAGFGALRGDCPMDLGFAYRGYEPSADVIKDITRLETLFSAAKKVAIDDGPWLFGAYTLADVFFAPIAMRITTYGLPVSDEMAAYVKAHLYDPALVKWRGDGLKIKYDREPYTLDLPTIPWPGPSLF